MIRRLLARLFRIDCTGPWTSAARGGGPALDRTLDDELEEISIEAAERGLTERDREDWIDRERDIRADERSRHIVQADTAHGQLRRLSDVLYPKGTP